LKPGFKPLIVGKRIALRDRLPTDVDQYIAWQTRGEWLQSDAPWETAVDPLTSEREQKIRTGFLQSAFVEPSDPRKAAMILLKAGNKLIGFVNRYGNKRFPDVLYVGIDICEDAYLNQGLGTEALKLWVRYLFEASDAHKIETHTWSMNPRMMRVAEKLGFTLEGRERELIRWQGKWQDRIRYSVLRREWENRQSYDV
jgi:RimJ/RimL family protein N-acetyltransferase